MDVLAELAISDWFCILRRITSLISHSEGEHPDRLEETVTIAFRKVEMTFRGQLASGLLGPGVTFTDQFDAAQ